MSFISYDLLTNFYILTGILSVSINTNWNSKKNINKPIILYYLRHISKTFELNTYLGQSKRKPGAQSRSCNNTVSKQTSKASLHENWRICEPSAQLLWDQLSGPHSPFTYDYPSKKKMSIR
jgi:hypothetical protein